jgi:hypothetical protein
MKLKHKQPMWHSTFLHGVYKCLSTATTAVSLYLTVCHFTNSLSLLFFPLPPPHSLLHISAASHSCIPAFLHLPCSAPRYLSHTQQLAVVNDDEITTSDSPIPHHHPTAIIHHPSSIMRSFSLALGLFALPLAFAGDAPVVQDNPTGAQYIAKLPDKNNTSVRGAVVVATSANGTGTNVQVSISGLPATGGPFSESSHCCAHSSDH